MVFLVNLLPICKSTGSAPDLHGSAALQSPSSNSGGIIHARKTNSIIRVCQPRCSWKHRHESICSCLVGVDVWGAEEYFAIRAFVGSCGAEVCPPIRVAFRKTNARSVICSNRERVDRGQKDHRRVAGSRYEVEKVRRGYRIRLFRGSMLVGGRGSHYCSCREMASIKPSRPLSR
jgi:hypothetical protein